MRVAVCFLLAGLFLYNPFMAVGHGTGSLTVSRPASYRGTVASSEVEQFAQPMAGAAALLPDLEAFAGLIPTLGADAPATRYFLEQEVVATPQTGFSTSLWFRPPPAV